MAETFETARLTLRPFRMEDLQDIYEQVCSDPDVCRYYCGATRTKTKTKAWLAYRVTEAVYSDFYAWAAERRELHPQVLIRLPQYFDVVFCNFCVGRQQGYMFHSTLSD